MSDWRVSCVTCQEPVGEPFWPGGCACGPATTPAQVQLVAVIDAAWKSLHNAEDGENG